MYAIRPLLALLVLGCQDRGGIAVDNGNGGRQPPDTAVPHGSIRLAPDALHFEEAEVGEQASASFNIWNRGDAQLLVEELLLGSELTSKMEAELPTLLAPEEYIEADLLWTPAAIGSFESWASVSSDDPEQPEAELKVTGDGGEPCEPDPPVLVADTGGDDPHSMSFTAYQGHGPDIGYLTMSNEGCERLTIYEVYVNNDTLAPEGVFSVPWDTSVGLDQGESHTVEVSYESTGTAIDLPYAEQDQNVLHILSNDEGQPDYVIELYGTAL